jgi:hypothetical protein
MKPQSPIVSSRTRPRIVGTVVRDLLFLQRRNRLRDAKSSTVRYARQKLHLGLQYRRLEGLCVGVGQVEDKCLARRLLVIWEAVSEDAIYQVVGCLFNVARLRTVVLLGSRTSPDINSSYHETILALFLGASRSGRFASRSHRIFGADSSRPTGAINRQADSATLSALGEASSDQGGCGHRARHSSGWKC